MSRTLKEILRSLNEYQLRYGYEEYNDDSADTIYDADDFVIRKSEWTRALSYLLEMPSRPINAHWNEFVSLGYLSGVKKGPKGDEAILRVSFISEDIVVFSKSIKEFLGLNKDDL